MAVARDSKGRFVKVGAQFDWSARRGDAGIAKTRDALDGVLGQLHRMNGGAGGLISAAGAALSFATPAVDMLKAGAVIAFDFESKMQGVNAILNVDADTLDRLSMKAKELGATTKFTAREAAEGMEMLASAGFTADETMKGIDGTLALAAAGALKLSNASMITGNILNGMGLSADKAGHVADMLAKGAAESATNVEALGVAFKYSAAQARSMGITAEENTWLLGAMADAGMRGSSGGTALQNMLSKLVKPTEIGAAAFKKWHIQMTELGADGKKHMRPIADIASDLSKQLGKIEDPIKRAALQEQIFGKIGQKAYSALDARIKKHAQLTEEERRARSVESFGEGGNVEGAAKRMADMRLKGVAGAFELFKSAMEGFWLEVFNKDMLAPIEKTITKITEFVGGIVSTLQALSTGADPAELEKQWGSVIVGIAMGVRDAITTVADTVGWLSEKIYDLSEQYKGTFGSSTIASIAKFAVLFVMVAAAVAPVLLAVGALVTLITTVVIPGFMALGSVAAAVFSPITLVVGAVVLAFMMVRKENESVLETLSRVWGIIKSTVLDVWENAVKPFWDGLREGAEFILPIVWGTFQATIGQMKDTILELWNTFSSFFSGTGTDWKGWGQTISLVLGGTVNVALEIVKTTLLLIENTVKGVRQAFAEFAAGNILAGLSKLGITLLDNVLEPLRMILRGAVQLADATFVPVPDAVRDFAYGGLALAKAKNNLAAEDDDGAKPSFVNYGYIPSLNEGAADVRNAQNEGAPGADDLRDSMEAALAAHEKNKKPCETTVNSNLNLDGKTVAKNQAKYKTEMDERAGFSNPPYARRMMLEHGNAPGR